MEKTSNSTRTPWLLKSGKPAHILTPEDRRKGALVRAQRAREAAKPLAIRIAEETEKKAEEIVARYFGLMGSEDESVAARMLVDALDRHLGKAVQRMVSVDVTPTTRLEDLPREQRDQLIAEKKRQLELLLSKQPDVDEE